MNNVPRNPRQPVDKTLLKLIIVAAVLCGLSIVQLSIATAVMRHSNRLVATARADPPFAISAIFPLWLQAAALPWYIAVGLLYGAVVVRVHRQSMSNGCNRLLIAWAIVSAVSTLATWFAMLPLRTCCV